MPKISGRFAAFLRGIIARSGEYLDMCFLNEDARPRAITLQAMCRNGRCERFWQAEIFRQNAKTLAAFRHKVRAIGQASAESVNASRLVISCGVYPRFETQERFQDGRS
jgi:hypothetical protein